MTVSVIIPVYNNIEAIEECVKLNITHAQNPCEWIIIDNDSDSATKNGLQRLKQYADEIGQDFKIFTESENTGVAKAWNKGLTLCKNSWVCILNNDCVMMPKWDVLLASFNMQHHLAISTPFVMEGWMFKKPYSLHDFLSSGKNYLYYSTKNSNRIKPGVFGGVVFFGQKQFFDKVGTFDENFWLSLEDYDYLLRAQCLGLKIGTVGAVTAFHLVSVTRKKVATNVFAENQKYFEQKWGWNFEKIEHKFPNKQIRSFNKFLFKYFDLMSTLQFCLPRCEKNLANHQ